MSEMLSCNARVPLWFGPNFQSKTHQKTIDSAIYFKLSPGLVKTSMIAYSYSTWSTTIFIDLIATPSSANFLENGGIDPGVNPPTSAWWPLEAV